MMLPLVPPHGLKISFASTLLVLGLALAVPGLAAEKKAPTPTPSTLPPTSPRLAIPPVDPAASASQQSGKLISSEMSGRDLEFFNTAAAAGGEQSYLANLLRTKASSDQIKALAETLSGAQDEENQHLAGLAARKGLTLSLEPTAAQKKEGAALEKLTGANYDKAVMDKIVAAGQHTMTAYQNAAESSDPEIKRFASQMLPLAEEKRHLVEKMTGVGNRKEAQPSRPSAASETPSATPAATPPVKSTPAPPPTSPAKTTSPDKTSSTGKPTPTPKPTVTPTPIPAASTRPIATPPGQTLFTGAPAPILPAILPSKHASSASLPAPIPPPIPAN